MNRSEENVINESYNKYKNITNTNTFTIYENIVKNLYNNTVLINKKKNLSELLVKLYEEIKFKLNIINKIVSKK